MTTLFIIPKIPYKYANFWSYLGTLPILFSLGRFIIEEFERQNKLTKTMSILIKSSTWHWRKTRTN